MRARTTTNIDDQLLRVAAEYTQIKQKTELVPLALKQLIAYHAGVRLAKLGDTQLGIREVLAGGNVSGVIPVDSSV